MSSTRKRWPSYKIAWSVGSIPHACGVSMRGPQGILRIECAVGQTKAMSVDGVDETGSKPLWRDLAANRPGQAARTEALARRRAAPVKTFLARAMGVHSNERAWRVGADGEEEVARRLRKLGNGWRVLHAVPVGEKGSDIDHVVIGPPGVFTLNTKNHSRSKVWVAEKTFMVNGQAKGYFGNSRFEAKRASRLLSVAAGFDVPVDPVIVVMAAQLTVKAQPPGVTVVARRRIRKWLTELPAILPADRVEEIYGVARRDSTWRPESKEGR
jgi:hypothetical protein